jgi:hypothetical protein
MGNRLPADDPALGAALMRLMNALKRGAEAFRDEWNSAADKRVQLGMADLYDKAALAIDQMRKGMAPRFVMDKGAIQAATDFISMLRTHHMRVPKIGPSPDGGVGMSWVFGTREGRPFEIDAVVLDWNTIEYREGFADADGFTVDTILRSTKELQQRLLEALSQNAQPASDRQREQ